jgi:hypothetical protein
MRGGRLRKVKLGMVVHLEFEKTPLIPILLKNIPIHIFKARLLYPFIYYLVIKDPFIYY